MQIAPTNADMLAIVKALRRQLRRASNSTGVEKQVARARREIERIRKRFKRRIDQRARYQGGKAWFPIHVREGIER